MEFNEKTLSISQVYRGKVISVHEDEVELTNGRISKREIVEHPGAVCISALTKENKLLFVEQYRYACSRALLELPAGKLNMGENPLEAGKRELMEETGAIGYEYIDLGWTYSSPGYSSEIIYTYFCRVKEFKDLLLDEDEILRVKEIPFDIAIGMVSENKIYDAKTQIAILKTTEYLNKI